MKKKITSPIYFGAKSPIYFETTQIQENGSIETYHTQDVNLVGKMIVPSVENDDAWVNGVAKLLEQKEISDTVKNTIHPMYQMVRAEKTKKLYEKDLNVSNFRIEPTQKIIYIDRSGKEVPQKEKILCKFAIIGNKPSYFEILTSEISSICRIIKKRYSNAIIDYGIKNVEKVIEARFRSETSFCCTIYCYFQQGWQTVNEKNIYLYDGLHLGKNIRIETGVTLPRYNYTKQQTGETLLYAMEMYNDMTSMSSMITFSVMGVLYRAFKESGFLPRFALFLNGRTASMKTTIGKILYTQICNDNVRDIPRRIDADTVVSFERAVILGGRDTITILDDYSPAKTMSKKNEMQNKLEAIIRMVGDGSSKNRSNVGLDDCRGEGVQGMVVITGELMGKGVSSNLRCLYCRMKREEVNEKAVTWFQENPFAFTTVIAAFAEYVSFNWNNIIEFIKYNFKIKRESILHYLKEKRLIDSAVMLQIANDIIQDFLITYCRINKEQVESITKEISNGIIRNAIQSQEMSTTESPSILFIKTVNDLMRINHIVLNTDRIMQTETSMYDGFLDEKYYYFNPEVVYKKVVAFLTQINHYFPLDLKEVMVALFEDGIIKASSNGTGKKTYCARIAVGNGKKQNFLKVSKERFDKLIKDSIEEIFE